MDIPYRLMDIDPGWQAIIFELVLLQIFWVLKCFVLQKYALSYNTYTLPYIMSHIAAIGPKF